MMVRHEGDNDYELLVFLLFLISVFIFTPQDLSQEFACTKKKQVPNVRDQNFFGPFFILSKSFHLQGPLYFYMISKGQEFPRPMNRKIIIIINQYILSEKGH